MTVTRVATDADRRASDARRADRWSALRAAWGFTSLPRLRACRRYATDTERGVAVVAGADKAGLTGVQTCGSVWACPCCSANVAAARATEVEAVLAGFRQANPEGRVYMVTLTVSHKASRALKSVWDGVAAGWQSVISGRAWQDEKAGHELEGFVRVFETTYGDNGWHVHVHALLLTRRALSVTEQKAWRLSMHDRWRHGIASERLVSSRRKGFDWKEVQGTGSLGQYFAKAVYEVTGASHKGARHGNVTPFGLLQFLATGEVPAGSDWLLDRDALELWREWEAGSKGRRQLTWSRGLRSRYLAEPEKSDEDLAAGEVDGETVAELPHPVYRRLAEAGRVPQMLLLARDDLPGLYSWLAALREPYSVPDRGRRWASSA